MLAPMLRGNIARLSRHLRTIFTQFCLSFCHLDNAMSQKNCEISIFLLKDVLTMILGALDIAGIIKIPFSVYIRNF